ncbi:hypothetical protein L1887_61291 [Cichorium endivia]|nr:hypothetical protein L1887_61291 [Cichorium endivia]
MEHAGAVDTGEIEAVDDVHAAGPGGDLVDLIVHTLVLCALLCLVVRVGPAEGVGEFVGHAGAGGFGRHLWGRREAAVLEGALCGDHGWRFCNGKRLEAGVGGFRVVGRVMGVAGEACVALVVWVGTDGDHVGEGSKHRLAVGRWVGW